MALHSYEIHGTGWISWSFRWRKYSSCDHAMSLNDKMNESCAQTLSLVKESELLVLQMILHLSVFLFSSFLSGNHLLYFRHWSETSLVFLFGNWRFPSDSLRPPWQHPHLIRLSSSCHPTLPPILLFSLNLWESSATLRPSISSVDNMSPILYTTDMKIHT